MTSDLTQTTWNRLDPALRRELDAVVGPPSAAFHSQYHDAMAWWLLLLLCCVGGGGAAAWDLLSDASAEASWWRWLFAHPLAALSGLWRTPQRLGLLASVVLGAWTALTWWHNHHRRGLALTSQALVVVRGRALRVLRYADVARATCTNHGRVGGRFTVLTLGTRAGATLHLTTTGNWASAALTRIAATGAQAEAPPKA